MCVCMCVCVCVYVCVYDTFLSNTIIFFTLDGIEPLVKMIRSDNFETKEAATLALGNLTSSNTHNCR